MNWKLECTSQFHHIFSPSFTPRRLTDFNISAPSASWHTDYRSTAFIFIGGLPFNLTEGDVITIFSQFGEPTYLNLVRDKETGKSKGFAFLKYEDQRSTDLAVDNLGGAEILGRTLKVDHTQYKPKDGEDIVRDNTYGDGEDEEGGDGQQKKLGQSDGEEEEARPMLKEERELAELIQSHDDDDPMKEYLVQQKKDEVAEAVALCNREQKSGKQAEKKHSKRRHGSHRDRDTKERDEEGNRHRHHRARRNREDEEEDGDAGRKHRCRRGEPDDAAERPRQHRRRSRSPSDVPARNRRD